MGDIVTFRIGDGEAELVLNRGGRDNPFSTGLLGYFAGSQLAFDGKRSIDRSG
jgi:hypothetical protein